jgi:hypothetical protein
VPGGRFDDVVGLRDSGRGQVADARLLGGDVVGLVELVDRGDAVAVDRLDLIAVTS